ncbi:hypothetical protein E4K64_17095 [Bradyrhizobium frederickii]|uniref:Uncharacterized protein n=1 Tax=Bradyrhizobium frederickii TaxID=2560054 RepID=A0A4Y9P2I8_9BRAD|nr:hypothetical protein E4K64_17095 [Bradyrhizobium frederickii]
MADGLAEAPPHPEFAGANSGLSPQAGRGEKSYLNGSWIEGEDCRMRRTLTGVPSETNSNS